MPAYYLPGTGWEHVESIVGGGWFWCVSVCACAGVQVYSPGPVQRSALVFETEPLTEPGAHKLSKCTKVAGAFASTSQSLNDGSIPPLFSWVPGIWIQF